MHSRFLSVFKAQTTVRGRRFFSDEVLRKTPIYDLHKSMGATTTGFGGWDMPLYYKPGIMKEHLHCRAEAGLFDVSHMVPVRIHGKDRVAFMERVTVSDIKGLPEGTGTLSSIPNECGGLIDDCIVTNAGDYLYLVINAGHEDKDLPHMNKYAAEFGDVTIEPLENKCIFALQGPKAAAVLASMCDADMSTWSFMTAQTVKVNGIECYVARSGYTGEDGFEILCEGSDGEALATKLLENESVNLIGLGARDSLRLEAGLCLYGNDIDDSTTPVEAGLLWTIPKVRRADASFVGAETIMSQIKDKKLVTRKRVGFTSKGPPPRAGDKVYNMDGEEVGHLTSGCYGPSIKGPVAMGYVQKGYTKNNTELQVEIRGKMRPLKVTKLPVVEPGYFRG